MMEILINVIKVVLIPVVVLCFVPILIWIERKASAYIQDRRGPNRTNILGIRLGGIIQNVADVIKLLMKEDFIPDNVNRFLFILAPFITMFIAIATIAVIPFADEMQIGGVWISFQVADLNVGLLYIFAMVSLGIYGLLLAGWASNNKYSLLGGLRASSQMISYEIALSLSVISIFMLSESVQLTDIVKNQTEIIWGWNVFRQPLAFILFLTAAFAEVNRLPFDLPEGESEIVAGFHTEYSSMKFALFFMGEYAAMVVSAAVITSLFFGGWQVPFLSSETLRTGADFYFFILMVFSVVASICLGFFLIGKFKPARWKDARDYESMVFGVPLVIFGFALGTILLLNGPVVLSDLGSKIFAAVLQFGSFMAKIAFFAFFFVWVRWTLPRFRYDQLMRLGWKVMIPLALLNIVVTGLIILVS